MSENGNINIPLSLANPTPPPPAVVICRIFDTKTKTYRAGEFTSVLKATRNAPR